MRAFIKFFLCVSVACTGTPFSQAALPSLPSRRAAAKKTTPTAKTKAETPDRNAPNGTLRAYDVALSGKNGVLLGQVVDPKGAAVAGVPVALRAGGRLLAQSKSNAQGHFAFAQLRGGVYQVVATEGFATFRAWAAGTAPKSAKPKAILVVGETVVRGQKWQERGRWRGQTRRWLRNPVIMAGIVGTAVAVPLAVQTSKEDGNGGLTGVPEATEALTEGPAS